LISINAIRARRGEPAALIRSGKVFAMTRLLIAVDGSAHSDNATRLAIDLARRCGPAEIFVITVMPMLSGEVMTFVPKEMIDRYYQEEGAKAPACPTGIISASAPSARRSSPTPTSSAATRSSSAAAAMARSSGWSWAPSRRGSSRKPGSR
jgi:hypothetical protein